VCYFCPWSGCNLVNSFTIIKLTTTTKKKKAKKSTGRDEQTNRNKTNKKLQVHKTNKKLQVHKQ
jgi:hypothetical protein